MLFLTAVLISPVRIAEKSTIVYCLKLLCTNTSNKLKTLKMTDSSKKNKLNRRDFLNKGLRYTVGIGIGAIGVAAWTKLSSQEMVWQLDPSKCRQCGRCATSCVKTPSAVKCFHVYALCGYCDLCGGYFRPETKNLTTAAENQLCPTNAIKRKFIEDPFFEYDIDQDLCIGCAKCVAGCGAFGNGSLQLQVHHKLCDNCNQCSIARDCPSEAYSRVPAKSAYLFQGIEEKDYQKQKG
ncbi:MAG: ferredoxin [Bacteroidetes bacterium]|nr:ferredoxin [Bacteroidota bacterium]